MGPINSFSFCQCPLYPSVSFASHTKLRLYSYLLRLDLEIIKGLKDEDFDICKWQAEKRVTFLFLTVVESWEKQSASDLCMRPGHGDKSATPKCLSEIWSRTCTEYNVLLFQETGRGTAVLLSCLLGG